MFLMTVTAATSRPAAAAGQILGKAANYGTSGLTTWLQHNVVMLLVVLIGITLLLLAQKANVSKVIMTVGLGLVALFWLGLAASGNTDQVGKFLVGLVTS